MSNLNYRGPKALSDILGELFTVRGYGQLRVRQELENAWNKAVGEACCHQTLLGEVRRGVLNVTVAHPTLLEELSAFRKHSLLKALSLDAPATRIHDIRFRVGSVVRSEERNNITDSPTPVVAKKPNRSQPPSPMRSKKRSGSKLRGGPGSDHVGS